MSKNTKTTKTAAKTVTSKKAVKAAPAAKTAIGETAQGRVYKVKKQFANGVRANFTKAIPTKGATLADIAKRAKLPVAKARSYAYWLASNGYLTRVAA